MRLIPCPLCEKDHTRPVNHYWDRGVEVKTVLCRSCGLVYHNPVIEESDRETLAMSFRRLHTDARPRPRYLKKMERRWSRQWAFIERVFRPDWRILEVGSGLGLAAAHLQERGAQVVGVEPDPDQARYARERGLNVLEARFEEVDFGSQPFDFILSSHVIEHFPEPLRFLERIRELVHQEGWLFLETPNILAPKVSPLRLYSLPHNFYFSPQTLTWLLVKAGWQVQALRVFRRDVFQVLARPCPPRQPVMPEAAARQVSRALAAHAILYYLELLFLWRRFRWWQRLWMYSTRRGFPVALGLEKDGGPVVLSEK